MNAVPNYNRFPGPGDLWRPADEAEPAFDMADAADNVERRMPDWERSELLCTVAETAPVLVWLAANAEIPPHLRGDFRRLLAAAESVQDLVAMEYDALNDSGDMEVGDDD